MTTTLGEAAAGVLAKTPRPWDGGTITEAGAYLNVPMSQYHGNPDLFDGPAISSSGLREIFTKSPAHYWNGSLYNPDREAKEPTDAMILGSAVHKIISREAGFSNEFVVMPEDIANATGKGSRTAKWDFEAEMKKLGRMVLSPDMWTKVQGMVKAVKSSPFYNDINEGMPEVSIFYRDDKTGIWIKARPDSTLSDWSIGLDLKCTVDVSDSAIARIMNDREYRMQSAMICEAVKQAVGADMNDFGFLFAESVRPHCRRMESVHPDDLDLGKRQVRAALDVFKRCWDASVWPGPENPAGDGGYFRMTESARAWRDRRIELLEQIAA